MKSRLGVDSCCTQAAAQWWLVATSPSGETKLAEQPRSRTAERITWCNHSSVTATPWAARRRALGKLSKVHIPSSPFARQGSSVASATLRRTMRATAFMEVTARSLQASGGAEKGRRGTGTLVGPCPGPYTDDKGGTTDGRRGITRGGRGGARGDPDPAGLAADRADAAAARVCACGAAAPPAAPAAPRPGARRARFGAGAHRGGAGARPAPPPPR